ncbi:MAG: hypothetical protein WKF59_22305 [Chitinophagaceae bacterium]
MEALCLLIFSLPWLIYRYYRYKALQNSNEKQKAYWTYTSAMYLLNQLGFYRDKLSPLQFAKMNVDPIFKTNLSGFIQAYHKSKYSSDVLTASEKDIVANFYTQFDASVTSQIPFKNRFSKFLNIYRTINYFTKQKV